VLANLKIILKIGISVKTVAILFHHISCCETQEHCLNWELVFTWRFWASPKQNFGGARWRSWLRQWATSRNVAGSQWQNFSPTWFFQPRFGPGVDSAS